MVPTAHIEGDIQVLIVGGGLGGLSLAASLYRSGLEPVVVERTEQPANGPGMVDLWPDVMPLLGQLGIGDEVGTTVTSWIRRQPDGTVTRRLDAGDATGGFVVARYARLRDRLRDVVPDRLVRTGVALRSLDPGPDTVTAEFDHGVREPFDIVVGADGAHSRTRELLGSERPVFCGTTSMAVPVPPALDITNASEIWTTDGAVFRVVPTDEEAALARLTVPTETPGLDWAAPEGFADRCPTIEWLLPEIIDAVAATDVQYRDDFRARTDVLADGRVALVGDAAHARHRCTGIGATLAIEDAAVLTMELAGRDDPPAARLADYAARQRSRLARLGRPDNASGPLADIDSPLAARCPAVPGVRGARLAACFGQAPPTPQTRLRLDDA